MSNVVPFRKPSVKQTGTGNTLCREGHHKWKILQDKQFDSRQGRLVTLFECERCHKRKTELI